MSEQHKILVGSVVADNSGRQYDRTRDVVFTGELLAEVHEPGYHNGKPTDTRGTHYKLFRVDDGRLIVHCRDWSNWQGEPTTYSVDQVTEEQLKSGDYYHLAHEAGMVGALSLDDVLRAQQEDEEF